MYKAPRGQLFHESATFASLLLSTPPFRTFNSFIGARGAHSWLPERQKLARTSLYTYYILPRSRQFSFVKFFPRAVSRLSGRRVHAYFKISFAISLLRVISRAFFRDSSASWSLSLPRSLGARVGWKVHVFRVNGRCFGLFNALPTLFFFSAPTKLRWSRGFISFNVAGDYKTRGKCYIKS